MKREKKLKFSFSGFFILFITITIAVTISILVCTALITKTNNNYWIIAIVMFVVILILAIICTVIDMLRRYKMVEKPSEQILKATEEITNGNFDINLIPNHTYDKFDKYDIIMENINTMAKELSKNEILKKDFISNVSHEIKTPLSVIQSYATILQSDKIDKKTRNEYLKNLVIQTNKLSSLVTNILKLNKLDSQEIIPEIKPFELGEQLRQCVLQFESLVEKKNLNLDCEIDDVKISSAESYLEIVWNNLISNAIKFTDDGGKINVKLKAVDDFVIVQVKDSGCGISSETGKHIFDKFYQGDTSHSKEGNGLGLALVKKVIDILGGEISVESEIGKGSTFTVKLKKGDLWNFSKR